MAANPLVGTWRLVSCHYETRDGRIGYPFGQDAAGYIVYSGEGRVLVAISAGNRSRQASEDFQGGTVEEKATAYDGYVSYAGTYDFLGDRVVHHVELCQFPNWVGTDLVRFVDLVDDRVTLRTVPFVLRGVEQTSLLAWERVRE